jgi:hypothetical protein
MEAEKEGLHQENRPDHQVGASGADPDPVVGRLPPRHRGTGAFRPPETPHIGQGHAGTGGDQKPGGGDAVGE